MNRVTEISNLIGREPLSRDLREFFSARGVKAWLVGGVLRDLFLERRIYDWDLVVDGDTLALARSWADLARAHFVVLDRERGIARVVMSETSEHSTGWVDFAPLHGDIATDLAQRDFTINAMAWDLAGMVLVDPLGGQAHLAGRLLEITGERVFVEDPLRLLRVFRFSAELGFALGGRLRAALESGRPALGTVAGERIRDELLLLLDLPADLWLQAMEEYHLLDELFPGLADMRHITQNDYHRYDVFEHSLETVRELDRILADPARVGERTQDELRAWLSRSSSAGRSVPALLRLGALYHDIGKPAARKCETDRVTFIGHDEIGSRMVMEMARKYRLGRLEGAILGMLVRHHLRPVFLAQLEEITSRAFYRFFRDTGPWAPGVLLISWADVEAGRGSALTDTMIVAHHDFVSRALEKFFQAARIARPPRLINGHDLMHHLGMQPGPRMGELLSRVEEAAACEEIHDRREALALARSILLLGGG